MPVTTRVATQKATAVTSRCSRKRMSPPTSRRPGRVGRQSTAGGAGAYQILLLRVALEPLRHEGTGHDQLHPVLTRPGEGRPGQLSRDSLTGGGIRNAGVHEVHRARIDRTVAELGSAALNLEEEPVPLRR